MDWRQVGIVIGRKKVEKCHCHHQCHMMTKKTLINKSKYEYLNWEFIIRKLIWVIVLGWRYEICVRFALLGMAWNRLKCSYSITKIISSPWNGIDKFGMNCFVLKEGGVCNNTCCFSKFVSKICFSQMIIFEWSLRFFVLVLV